MPIQGESLWYLASLWIDHSVLKYMFSIFQYIFSIFHFICATCDCALYWVVWVCLFVAKIRRKDEQGQDIQAGKRVQGQGQELHKDSQRESGEGLAVLLQRPPQQEAWHALPLDPTHQCRHPPTRGMYLFFLISCSFCSFVEICTKKWMPL